MRFLVLSLSIMPLWAGHAFASTQTVATCAEFVSMTDMVKSGVMNGAIGYAVGFRDGADAACLAMRNSSNVNDRCVVAELSNAFLAEPVAEQRRRIDAACREHPTWDLLHATLDIVKNENIDAQP